MGVGIAPRAGGRGYAGGTEGEAAAEDEMGGVTDSGGSAAQGLQAECAGGRGGWRGFWRGMSVGSRAGRGWNSRACARQGEQLLETGSRAASLKSAE